MTGFGRAEYLGDCTNAVIEIRSVNSRFFDLKFRGYVLEMETEKKIRSKLEKLLTRGNISINIDIQSNSKAGKEIFNKERYELIQKVLKEIHVSYGQKINLSDIVSFQDLLKSETSSEVNENTIVETVFIAIDQVAEMRIKEGDILYQDLKERLSSIELTLGEINAKSENFSAQKEKDLRKKIIDLTDKNKFDESRLIQEVAYLSERSDITEEIVRCKSHLKQLDLYLKKEEPVGKKIGFLIQEINREINTIGSKSHQSDVTKAVVEIKSELEKIREQTFNIL